MVARLVVVVEQGGQMRNPGSEPHLTRSPSLSVSWGMDASRVRCGAPSTTARCDATTTIKARQPTYVV
jgi:hypothetical protein